MSGGVAAGLEEALAKGDGLPDGEDLVQAALFDLAPEETGALDAPSPLSRAIEPKARRGRPPGSRNRRTDAVAAWLLGQHRHPLAVMMEAYSMAPADLAERIGLRKTVEQEGAEPVWSNAVLLEVVKLQLRMAEAVAPYVAQKMPQAVQVSAAAAVQLSISGVSLPARGVAGQGQGATIEGEVLGVMLPKSDEEVGRDG